MKLFLNRRPCIGDVKRAYAESGAPGGGQHPTRSSVLFQLTTSCFVQFLTSLCSATTDADNVALPAFARRTQQSIDIPVRRAHSSKPAAAACGGRMGQTVRRTPDRCIDPMRAVPVKEYCHVMLL